MANVTIVIDTLQTLNNEVFTLNDEFDLVDTASESPSVSPSVSPSARFLLADSS